MSKLSITRACAAAALLAMSSAALGQDNNVNAVDPAMNTMTADPLANDTSDVIVTDPLANDPMATTTTDPLAIDPMLNETDVDDDDDDFPWGLLGLLGLAGLLGGRRRDDDVRVDTTRDTRDTR
ncbi:MAG: WGxxGxxG family protein [Sphingomicrobium sp.]